MADPARAEEVLRRLHEIGVRVSIDDFGTGYSSLAYLKDLPVDEVKIDQKFVRGMQNSHKDACIVRAVIDLGHNFGLRVVAEGAENRESSDLLAAWGCDIAQGYFFSRPLPPSDLQAWLTENGAELETMTSLPAQPSSLVLPADLASRGSASRGSRSGTAARVDDRRSANRYITRDMVTLISWIDGGAGRKINASLKNVSADGALIETDSETLPGSDSIVMMRLVSHVTDWVIRAKVVGVTTVTPQPPGRFSFRKKPEKAGSQIRLTFMESCPYDFFKASISGFVVERKP